MEYVRVIQKVQSGERPAILTMLLCWSFEIAESFEFKHGFQIIRTCNFVPISNLDASMNGPSVSRDRTTCSAIDCK